MTKDEELKMRIEQDEQWAKMINRKWQGLSDDEAKRLAHQHRWNGDIFFVRAIEQTLKNKNT